VLTIPQAIILGLLQGVTELFPISSLGHSVLLPGLLGWNINQHASYFLLFLVATHFATATVLFLFFLKDWVRLIKGFFRSLKMREISDPDAKLFWLLVVGTIPAGILGLLFEDQFKLFFSNPRLVALFLVFNGLVLFLGDKLGKRQLDIQTVRHSDERISKLSWMQSLKVGGLQSLALFPGFSRTGAAMTGSLLQGLSHEDSARFAFLLATPIIGAASLLKLPELLTPENSGMVTPVLIGALCAAVAAFFSVKFLTKYFETKSLKPFAVYCLIAGLLCSAIFFWS
jgi:undecaprenyl-diphosphatase